MAAHRLRFRPATRTTGNARSGRRKVTTKPRLTLVKRTVLSAVEMRILKQLERLAAKDDHLRAVRRKIRPDYSIHGPFYSQAHSAYRLEYSEAVPGEANWSSSFYCEKEEDAAQLAVEARHTVKGREDWKRLHNKAKEIAASTNGFLYRTIIGEPCETFRKAQEKARYVGDFEAARLARLNR